MQGTENDDSSWFNFLSKEFKTAAGSLNSRI